MEIKKVREEIDRVDDRIFDLFRERMELVKDVARAKENEGLGIRNRIREREILTRLGKKDESISTYTRILYNTLFSVSKSLQTELLYDESDFVRELKGAVANTPALFPRKGTVAVQGAEGSYSQQAAYRMFPMGEVMFFKRFENVFDAVGKGLCEFGILPIENSSNGSVKEVYEAMKNHRFSVVRSSKQFIDHHLLAKPGARLSDIREVISQRQALGQCSAFLRDNPQILAEEYMDTALAAAEVAASDRMDLASISSKYCADLYGLQALPVKVQDSENNYTRFICITKDMRIYPGSNKISLMVSAPHEPGGLYHLLARFAALGLNITKLESRSLSGRDFEFIFYFDFEGSIDMPEVRWLLEDLRASSEHFQLLGNYLEV